MSDRESQNIDTENEEALRSLVRAIRLSQGEFSLILVRCNYKDLRDRIVQRLRELSPIEIVTIDLPPNTRTLLTFIKEKIASAQPEALMIFGLERVTAIEQLLTSTNQVREEFRKSFPFPLILWVNDRVLRKLIQVAPDFQSWTTTTEFESSTDELINYISKTAESLFANELDFQIGIHDLPHYVGASLNEFLEIELAIADLQSRNQVLEPSLEAELQFILGKISFFKEQTDYALSYYQKSLKFWQQQSLEQNSANSGGDKRPQSSAYKGFATSYPI